MSNNEEMILAVRTVVARMRNARHGLGSSSSSMTLPMSRAPISEVRKAALHLGNVATDILGTLYTLGARNLTTGVETRDLRVPFQVLRKLQSTGLINAMKDSRGRNRWFLTRKGISAIEKVGL